MIPCIKRQKVVKQGGSLTVLRCINKRSPVHGQEVCEDICARCPVRAERHKRSCPDPIKAASQNAQVAIPPHELINVTDEEVRQMILDAGLDVTDLDKAEDSGDMMPPGYPPLMMQLWSYKEALLKWQNAGRPTRTQEQVEKIHKEHCEPCVWYDAENKRCKGCGCKVSIGSIAVLNKIKMGTENCPKKKW